MRRAFYHLLIGLLWSNGIANSSHHPLSAFASFLLTLNSGSHYPNLHLHRSHVIAGTQPRALDRQRHYAPRMPLQELEEKMLSQGNDTKTEARIERLNRIRFAGTQNGSVKSTEIEAPERVDPPSLWFGDMKLPPSIASGLQAAGITAPLPIQAVSIMPIRRNRYTILHSETGSGKTLAYLLPILTDLHVSRPCQLLILVPSRELAVQTAAVVQKVWPYHGSRRAFVMVGNPPASETVEAMKKIAAPVVVATPKALMSLVRHLLGSDKMYSMREFKHTPEMALITKHLRAIVLDEVDALLLDREVAFAPDMKADKKKFKEFKMPASRALQGILNGLSAQQMEQARLASYSKHKPANHRQARRANKQKQLKVVACSASASRRVRQEVGRLFEVSWDEINVITEQEAAIEDPRKQKRLTGERGIGAVGIPENITHTWVPYTDDEDKLNALSIVLSKAGSPRVLAFLPDDAPLKATVEQFRQAGLKAQMLHETLGFGADGLKNAAAVKAYTSLQTSHTADSRPKATQILVTTFSSARGLDIPDVDCVILFSLPRHADDYLHVSGRTGRNGRAGDVFTFLRRDELPQVGLLTRQLGISMKPNSDIALARDSARERHARGASELEESS